MGKRFVVKKVDAAGGDGFLVFDSKYEVAVDGPFGVKEDAEARAAKREIRDAEAELLGEENGAGAEVT